MSVTTTDLWRMSATDLAEAIRSRQASSQEVIESHLRRIEAVNSSVNAVTVVLGEQALDAAKAADRAVGCSDLAPFHGVPFTVKGNIDLVGTPTTQGLKALAGAYPRLDAPVVERLKAAGAIPIGRTNLATFAVRWHCDSEFWGATVNPWDRSELRDPALPAAGVGRVPGDAPAHRRPDLHRRPLRGGHRPGQRSCGGNHPWHAHGHRRQRAGTARRGAARRHWGQSPSVGAGDRPSLPRGPMPRCSGGDRGQTRHHHAHRSQGAVAAEQWGYLCPPFPDTSPGFDPDGLA
jgi:hypothetical protein